MVYSAKHLTSLKAIVLLSLCLVWNISSVQCTLLCLSCQNVDDPSDCKVDLQHLVECDEHCLVTRNTADDGNFTYTLGCGNVTTCGTEFTTTPVTTMASITSLMTSVAATTNASLSQATTKSSPASVMATTTPNSNSTTATTTDLTTMSSSISTTHASLTSTTTVPIKVPTHGNTTTNVVTPLTSSNPTTTIPTTIMMTSSTTKSMGVSSSSEAPPTGSSSLVGKRDVGLYRRALPQWLVEKDDYCHQCCKGPQCNQHALKCVPGACYDEIEDCDQVIALTGLCDDVKKAKQLCKKSCTLCDLVDGQWAAWTAWSQCDVTCGNGTISRARNCSEPAPANGGEDCDGSAEEMDDCIEAPCPADGNWSSWGAWSECSITCGVGLQNRDRACNNPTPDADGLFCMGEVRDYVVCYRDACQDGHWMSWETWGGCSSSCGDGLRSRERGCTTASLFGHSCVGDAHQAEFCMGDNCPDISAFTATGLPQDGEDNGTLILSLVITNIGSDYNSSTGEFQCRLPGLYSFFVSIEKQLNVSEAFCHLLLNGNSTVLIAARTAFIHSDSYVQSSNSANLRLVEGDVVKLGMCSAAETFTPHSTFSGNFVAALD